LGWGYQPERVPAGIYLLFYTLSASLPLLVGSLFVYNYLGSLCLFL
jgi:NADH-ubiquinone oxidoreductase chain 4